MQLDGDSYYAYNHPSTYPPSPPPPPDPHPEETAVSLIDQYGGKDNLDTDGLGESLADLAKSDLEYGWRVVQEVLGNEIDQNGHGRLKEGDKDEVAQSFIQSLSDDDLLSLT
jgi:hypothetical protein